MTAIAGPAIATHGLTRDFGAGRGLFDLNLEVQQGEAYGYLGPNGAGKSTTLRLLMGLIHPTSGSASIFGVDVTRDPVRVKGMVGYLPGELAQFGDMRGGQVLSLLAGLRGGIASAVITTLARRLGLDLSRRYREYSRGNKQKLAVVAALMGKPRLLILDEPTTGLDPIVQQEFYQLLAEARDAGATVLMSSHLFAEVEQTCTRVGIIRAGRLIRDGDLHQIHSMRVHRVTISFEGDLDAERLNHVAGVSLATIQGNLLTCHVQGDFDPLLRAISTVKVTNLVSQEPSLEEVFLAYYKDDSAPQTRPEREAGVPEPEPRAPIDAEVEALPAGETVYFATQRAAEQHPAAAADPPTVEPGRRSAFELRDWLASELESAPEPVEASPTVQPEPQIEQLAWTDPGPAVNPALSAEVADAPDEAPAAEADPPASGPSLFDHRPDPSAPLPSPGEDPYADR